MFTKAFWKAACTRMIRTGAQVAVASIGTAAVLSDVNWLVLLSTVVLSMFLSLLNSIITGLPEV